ncbi:MAG: DUF6220 domain-containing protein [Candidatus Limnocylindria bacterium]
MLIWRYIFVATAALFVAAVVVQVFLAGVGLFGAGEMTTHVEFGYLVATLPLLPLLLAWPARVGGRTAALCAASLLAAQVQTFLPLARDSAPMVAALHPVNALVVFGLGLLVARRGLALLRSGDAAPATAAAHTTQRA